MTEIIKLIQTQQNTKLCEFIIESGKFLLAVVVCVVAVAAFSVTVGTSHWEVIRKVNCTQHCHANYII